MCEPVGRTARGVFTVQITINLVLKDKLKNKQTKTTEMLRKDNLISALTGSSNVTLSKMLSLGYPNSDHLLPNLVTLKICPVLSHMH